MKKWYVYEIVNLMGTVEYVGETMYPKRRWSNHRCNANSTGAGKFYNRSDIFMNIVMEFDNRRQALDYQYELQKEYGIKTDLDHKFGNKNLFGKKKSEEWKTKISLSNKGKVRSIQAKINYSLAKKIKNNCNDFYTCPNCGKEGQSSVMYRWHFDNCKHKIVK